MGVGAGKPEGIHTRPGWTTRHGPGRRLGGHLHGQPLVLDHRVGGLEVQVLRNNAALQSQRGLYQTRDARGGLQVADVGLHRADQQRLVRRSPPPVDRRCGAEFGGITHPRPGAVGLQVVDFRRGEPGAGQGVLDGSLLGRPFRYRESRTRPILVHRRAADHGPDPVAIGLGLFESLEDDDAAAFATHVAVRRRVEGLAPPVGRQHARLGAQRTQAAEQDGLDSTHQRDVGIASMQARRRLVHSDQRRRARGVDDHCRPFEAKHERDPADGGTQGTARDGVEAGRCFGILPRTENQVPVVVVAHAGIDPGASPLEALGIDAGVFQSPPTGLQHHTLLGIQQLGFEGRDPEELGVELVDAVDERAVTTGIPFHRAVRKQQSTDAANPRPRRTLRNCRLPGVQQPPEGVQVLPTREPAGHAHDGDGLPGFAGRTRLVDWIS